MFASERQMKILEIIQEEGRVQVEHLAQEMNVSPMTIRRDLEKLQEDGKIERCYGGAVLKQEVTYEDKIISKHDEKNRIARAAAVLVKEGDTIFLDSGTTTLEIARLIGNMKNILIVTNDLQIASSLKNSEADVIVCGGRLQKSTGSMLGYYATQMLEMFRFDIGFFGAASIDEDFQVQTPTIDKAFLKKSCVRQCQRSYLTVDDSKFGKKAVLTINHLRDYSAVITNCDFTENEYQKLAEQRVEIIRV